MQPTQRSIPALLIALTLLASGALLLATSVGMFVSAFLPLINGEAINTSGTIYSIVFGFETLLLLAAAYFSFQKYQLKESADQPIEFALRGWQVVLIIIVTSAALGLGYLLAENSFVNWISLPVLTIPAVALPVLLLFGVAARRLSLGPRWQVWSILGLGMTVGPILLFVIELFILMIIIVFVSVFIATQPGIATEAQSLMFELSLLQDDPDAVLELLTPFLVRPGVIVTALAFISVIVPFTEELLKPIGVWLFAGKLTSPAQGFALGALSGAAFGLVETLGSSAQTVMWAEVLSTRMGTALLHITCSALMGWGIASAWQERKVLRLFAMYLLASLLHGVWNAGAVLISFAELTQELNLDSALNQAGPWMLGLLIAIGTTLALILVFMNRRLAKVTLIAVEPAPPPPDVVT